jgi:putative membrane protein
MGGADVVPGVSGGTVALILGIYERLVTCISRFDLSLLTLLRARRWSEAAAHVDLFFLGSLGGGIALGILTLGGLMNHLVTSAHTRERTLAAFFGMILASTVLVARTIRCRTAVYAVSAVLVGLAGAGFAFWFVELPRATAEPTHLYVLACGMVAICAMILPGVSGAYVLLILGVYVHLTDILKGLPRGHFGGQDGVTVVVFAAGCAIGLISFSKVLRWLLTRAHTHTMAALCGFMLGALRRIWPFQHDTTPHLKEFKLKEYVNYWPASFDGEAAVKLAIGLAAMLFVFAIHWLTSRQTPEVGQR